MRSSLSEDEIPLPVVSAEVTSSNWLYTTVKYTMNDAVTKLYCIAISQKEWAEYQTAHPGEDPKETVKANGKPYSYDGAVRVSTWATQKETPIYILAVAENEVGKFSELVQVSYTTPSYVKGKATVDIAVSDVKATTAHSVCTPSSDAAYYLMKHANDTQWSVIDQQEQGGIYEYVCRNGYELKATDVYDWTGLVGTYSDGKIEFADNGAVGGPYALQGYCWVAFDSDGNPVGRADAVIPVNISFEK